MSDLIVRAIDRAAGLRVVCAVTTDLAREAARRHEVEGLGACALGRALTSSLLLATLTKGGERVTLQVRGDGPMGGVTADATDGGDVRGYLLAPEMARRSCEGRGRVVEVLGRHGVVNVLRDLGLLGSPPKDGGAVGPQIGRYQGQVALLTGEIDEDVEGYLRTSEQIPSALGCDVLVEGDAVSGSAGVLVQQLPEALAGRPIAEDRTEADRVMREAQHALRVGVVWELLRSGERSPRAFAEAVCGRPLEVLDERPLRWQCRCSIERVEQSLELLSTIDLDEIIAHPGHAEVTCNFCNERYVVDKARLEVVRAAVAHGPRGRN